MNLREKRMEKGITQVALAKQTGLTNQAICNYEQGIREPRLRDAQALARALGCTVDELIGDPDDESGRGPDSDEQDGIPF